MTWVAWRLQRNETVIAAGILVLLAALLVPTGLSMAHAYSNDGLGSCLSANPSFSCNNSIESFQSHYETLLNLSNWFTLLPGLIGVLFAAPFLLDLENGTYRLAWTQSITRKQWIGGKLALPIAGALVVSGILILLTMWWRTPFVHLNGRLDTGTYDTQGVVVIGYSLFALGLGLAIGVLWRRAAAALILAFIGYVAVRIFVDTWLRNRLVSPVHATWKGNQPQPADLFRANVMSEQISGHGIVSSSSKSLFGGSSAQGAMAVPGPGIHTTIHAVYQPESHYWPLQLTELGLFAGIAIVLILVAAWWTHERAA